jgi:hypothetical protein
LQHHTVTMTILVVHACCKGSLSSPNSSSVNAMILFNSSPSLGHPQYTSQCFMK